MAQVSLTVAAQADIREAFFPYEERRQGLGLEFLLQVDETMTRIAGNPLQFPQVLPGVRRALMRRFPFAVYFLEGEPTTVVAVLHQRRHPGSWEKRLQGT
jgi:plasmid stabilization system protein ParE